MIKRVSWVPFDPPPGEPIGPTLDGFVRDSLPIHDAEHCHHCRPIQTPTGRVWIHSEEDQHQVAESLDESGS